MGSQLALAVVVAMTAGYQTVLVAATAFWLAVRHLLKAGSLRVGVAVHQQESSSDRPLPVSISGDGCTDRMSVTDRAETCVTGFRLVDPASQQQRCRLCSSWEQVEAAEWGSRGAGRRWAALRSQPQF